MEKFYITFGSEGHPFRGGWTVVYASDEEKARALAIERYGLDRQGFTRFCMCYSEERFAATKMGEMGSFGAFCHETIREVPNE